MHSVRIARVFLLLRRNFISPKTWWQRWGGGSPKCNPCSCANSISIFFLKKRCFESELLAFFSLCVQICCLHFIIKM
jgi:hypothetical protein